MQESQRRNRKIGFYLLILTVVNVFFGIFNALSEDRQISHLDFLSTSEEFSGELVDIVIAVQQVPRGFTIPPNAVTTRQWPKESVPASAIFNLESVIGKKARTDIFREQPILTNMLVDDLANLANAGSDLAAILPNNRTATTLYLPPQNVPQSLRSGDRVDIVMTFNFKEANSSWQTTFPDVWTLLSENKDGDLEVILENRGELEILPSVGYVLKSPSEEQRARVVTQRTVQDALVAWVGYLPTHGRLFFVGVETNVDDSTIVWKDAIDNDELIPVTIALSPQDVNVIEWVKQMNIPISLILRSATSTSQVPTDPVNLQYIIDTFRADIPEKSSVIIDP